MISAGTLVFTMPLLLYHLYISINKKTTIAHFKENKYIEEFINEYYE